MYGNCGKQLVLQLSSWINMQCTENTKPHYPRSSSSSPLSLQWDIQQGCLRQFSLWGESQLLSPWDPIFLLQTFWNALYLEWNIERKGSWSGISCPSPSGHIWQCGFPRTTHMVRTTRTSSLSCQLPLCSRPDKYALFSAGIVICLCLHCHCPVLFSLPEDMAYREALPNSPHKT